LNEELKIKACAAAIEKWRLSPTHFFACAPGMLSSRDYSAVREEFQLSNFYIPSQNTRLKKQRR
jgi:hypothetical protein